VRSIKNKKEEVFGSKGKEVFEKKFQSTITELRKTICIVKKEVEEC